MNKFVRIPELVRITCSYATPADIARLALTCRNLFTRAIPTAWASVSDVSQLLLLFEEATCTVRNDPNGEFMELKLPETLDKTRAARFEFYAPFVKSLEIFQDNDQRISVLNPRSLIEFAHNRDLLPNLKCLELSTIWNRRSNFVFWVNIFASRSLGEVLIISPQDGEVEFPSETLASNLMSALGQRCPNIRALTFTWHHSTPADEEENLLDKYFSCNGTPIHALLAQFTSLTEITGSPALLETPALLALGSLPELRRLEVHYPVDEDIIEPGSTTLPPGSFPKLDKLTLNNIAEHTAEFIWTMPALVAQLRSLEVNFLPPFDDEEETGWTLQSFLPLICTHSPHIKELSIDFDCTSFDANQERYLCDLTETAFEALAKLKLVHLDVLHARMTDDGCIERLVHTWPKIEVLRWPHQPAMVSELSRFAKSLPKLRRLALNIDMGSLPGKLNTSPLVDISHQELRALESNFLGFGNLDGSSAAELYLYLRKLVPNAKLEPLISTYLELDSHPSRQLDLALVTSMNLMESYFSMIRDRHPDDSSLGPVGDIVTSDDSILTKAAVIWNIMRGWTRD
ncbi:unnamed protein product [Rhizoctonia solani]|uniref:F-box domain-containing protein n=1 Tax=Rhizoctonia solani TaxID=456999 RepID=A0A8H2Y165_9AGAM|nr:unnamed protein product [Rhizoctonia solani]